jgi:NADH dehydrogenase
MENLIFIAGATGFVGIHLLKRLSSGSKSVRCLVRSGKKADLCRSMGFQTFTGSITERESIKGALEGVSTVVHLVGIIEEDGDQTFEKVHLEGTANLIDEARISGVKHFFYQSALGASLKSSYRYYQTKAEAEEMVKESEIPYTIFRPSLIIGPGDRFTKSICDVLKLGPLVPVPGDGTARFQPIYIEDWINCFLKIINNPENRVFEFGGPEHLSYNEILYSVMDLLDKKKPLVHMPVPLVKAGIPFTAIFRPLARTVGINLPSFTSEQIGMLQSDNITDLNSVEKQFGFKPANFEEAIRKTLK